METAWAGRALGWKAGAEGSSPSPCSKWPCESLGVISSFCPHFFLNKMMESIKPICMSPNVSIQFCHPGSGGIQIQFESVPLMKFLNCDEVETVCQCLFALAHDTLCSIWVRASDKETATLNSSVSHFK